MASSSATPTVRIIEQQQQRHYCIVLTNNPRMIRSAQRLLSNTAHGTAAQANQAEQQSLPTSSSSQMDIQAQQQLDVPMQTRSKRRIAAIQSPTEQQVPTLMPQGTVIDMMPSNTRAYEKEIEADFQAQVQPILELYLQRTRRSSPINSVLDMSSYVQP